MKKRKKLYMRNRSKGKDSSSYQQIGLKKNTEKQKKNFEGQKGNKLGTL